MSITLVLSLAITAQTDFQKPGPEITENACHKAMQRQAAESAQDPKAPRNHISKEQAQANLRILEAHSNKKRQGLLVLMDESSRIACSDKKIRPSACSESECLSLMAATRKQFTTMPETQVGFTYQFMVAANKKALAEAEGKFDDTSVTDALVPQIFKGADTKGRSQKDLVEMMRKNEITENLFNAGKITDQERTNRKRKTAEDFAKSQAER